MGEPEKHGAIFKLGRASAPTQKLMSIFVYYPFPPSPVIFSSRGLQGPRAKEIRIGSSQIEENSVQGGKEKEEKPFRTEEENITLLAKSTRE